MSNGLNRPGVRAQARALSNSVEELQQLLSRALVGIEQRMTQQANTLNRLSRVTNALVELVGQEAVQNAVDIAARDEAVIRAVQEKAAIDEAIADGYVYAADVVTEESIIVGHETDEKGEPVGTGRQQIAFRNIDPNYKAALLGKAKGDKMKTPGGGEFEVKEIYLVDEEKGREILQAKAAKAAEQAAKADEDKDTAAQASE